MDVLRTTCSVMGSLEPEPHAAASAASGAGAGAAAWPQPAERLVGVLTSALAYWWGFARGGVRIVPNTHAGTGTAAALLAMLRAGGCPPAPGDAALQAAAVNASLASDARAVTLCCTRLAGRPGVRRRRAAAAQ